MKTNELSNSQHLRMISSRARVESLNDGRNITEDASVHESCGNVRCVKKCEYFWFVILIVELTSDQHHTNSEYFLSVSVRCNVTKTDRCQRSECEIQRGDVSRLWKIVNQKRCKKSSPTKFKKLLAMAFFYPYRWSSCIVSIVWHMNLVSECIEPSINGIAVFFTPLCIANCVPK